MSDNLKRPPTLEQILKAAPMLARASIEVEHALAASLPDGTPVTDEMIDGLLERCRLGQRVEIDVPMLAYEQWDYEKYPGKDNRNFVCFRGGEMQALGRTGKRKPFMRDHEQRESLARGGTLIESKTEQPEEGHHQIFQTVRLSAPWAVEMYLRGLMTTVSIGWFPTGPVICSACDAPIGAKCWHWPGDRLDEVIDGDGVKRKVRNRNGGGAILVRWIYTKAELIETSCVPVPGVPTAAMDQLRATLAASFPTLFADEDADEDIVVAPDPADKSPPSPAARSVDPQPERPQMADQTDQTTRLASLRKALLAALTLPESHRAHAATLATTDADAAEAFCVESPTVREAAVKSALDADPVVFTGAVTKISVRRSHGELALQLATQNEASAKKLAEQETELGVRAAAADDHEVETICSSRIPNLPGSGAVHANIVRALRKAGDPVLLEESLKALAGASNFVKAAGRAPGANEGADAGNEDALAAFETALAAFAKAAGKSPLHATEEFLATKQGTELHEAYDKARRTARGTR